MIRSHRLFGPHALSTTGDEALVVVPDGETWILKSLRVVNTGADPTQFDLGLAPLTDQTPLFWRTDIAGEHVTVDVGWQILEGGDELVARADAATLVFWGSGAKLVG